MARGTSSRLRELSTSRSGGAGPWTPREAEPPVDLAVFVLFSLLGLLLLLVAGAFFGTRSIESSLERDVALALQAAGMEEVEVEAAGLDVELSGSVPEAGLIEQAGRIASAVEGVRAVDVARVRVVVPASGEPTEIVAEPWYLVWDASEVTFSAEVASQRSADALTAAAETALGRPLPASAIEVDDRVAAEDVWLGAVIAVLELLVPELDAGEVTVNPSAGVMVVAGEVADRQTRRDLRTSADELLAAVGFEFVSGLTVEDAPPPPPREEVVELQIDLDVLLEGKVVEFEINSDVITAAGTALLDEVFDAVQQFPGVPIEIGGHADAQGDPESNRDLSERRAAAVLDYLVAQGADAERFVVVGYGETQPIADNSTAEGRRRNRRIEFTALEE